MEIVIPYKMEINELSLKAQGGVTSIAVDDTHFEYVSLMMGTGTMYVDILNADEAFINCKAGYISIKDLKTDNYRLKTSEGGTVEISADSDEEE